MNQENMSNIMKQNFEALTMLVGTNRGNVMMTDVASAVRSRSRAIR